MSEELLLLIYYLENVEYNLQECKRKFTELQAISDIKTKLQLQNFVKLFQSSAHYKPLIKYLEQLRQEQVENKEDLQQFEEWKTEYMNEKGLLLEYWKTNHKTKTTPKK